MFINMITYVNQHCLFLGLRILAFPCNQFAGQEPGNNEEIACSLADRKVKFDLFEKIDVNGDNASPLWKFLKVKVLYIILYFRVHWMCLYAVLRITCLMKVPSTVHWLAYLQCIVSLLTRHTF